MTTLSREQVVRHLGEVDDLTLSRIVATGASERELEEAIQETVREEELGEPTPSSSSAAVAKLRGILHELVQEERTQAESDYD